MKVTTLIALLALAGCSSPSEPECTPTLQYQVVDRLTRAPLVDSRVSVERRDWDDRQRAVIVIWIPNPARSGAGAVRFPRRGSYALTASAPGYLPATVTVEASSCSSPTEATIPLDRS